MIPTTDSLRFQVLGPVQAWRGEAPLALGSPQQQAVLVALLLNRGRPVSTQELVDGLWGPASAAGGRRAAHLRLPAPLRHRAEP
ncbi:hypothetical protein GCM10025734_51740 [Kitasatospora paranensis]